MPFFCRDEPIKLNGYAQLYEHPELEKLLFRQVLPEMTPEILDGVVKVRISPSACGIDTKAANPRVYLTDAWRKVLDTSREEAFGDVGVVLDNLMDSEREVLGMRVHVRGSCDGVTLHNRKRSYQSPQGHACYWVEFVPAINARLFMVTLQRGHQ